MKTIVIPLLGALLALSLGGRAPAADAARPAVVELFTSQGCSSCPPANDNVAALSARPDVLALSFGVTYWDQLGWKDTFASPRFTARQWDYAHALRHSNVATPQVVVNGRADVVGNRRGDIEALIRRTERPAGPAVAIEGTRVSVGAGKAPASGADVWLIRYDPRTIQVPVRAGENEGKTLPHKNVVRELTRLGVWKGQASAYPLAPAHAGLATAVIVQTAGAGPILAAVKG